nr:hypothetical protein [Streptomyces sp. S10(2018)]
MAVKTIWPIDHTCGHPADRDLADRPTERRAGFAEWLFRQECSVNCSILASLGTA